MYLILYTFSSFTQAFSPLSRLFHAKDRFETKLSEMPKLRTIIEHQSLTTTPTDGSEIQQANKGAMSTQTTEYSWVPVPDKSLVERYMRALPEEERPIAGSIGEQNRKSRLQFQLPLYDCNVDDARFADEKDKEVFRRFVENVRKHVIGVGQVKEVTANDKNNLGTDISDLDDVARGIAGIDLGPVKCKSCSDTIPVGDVGINTDHGPKNVSVSLSLEFFEFF
ncbi:unnamed protein product [Heligmosomoides polygyrus]|uniref:PET domain-containing protein n=1 Tax=Heligmosomoides polygyrus TaxID=6339 RepID=A0A183GBI0_HELPZ|nr:unnamed protein product [Heligmosomoides polygyrus]